MLNLKFTLVNIAFAWGGNHSNSCSIAVIIERLGTSTKRKFVIYNVIIIN